MGQSDIDICILIIRPCRTAIGWRALQPHASVKGALGRFAISTSQPVPPHRLYINLYVLYCTCRSISAWVKCSHCPCSQELNSKAEGKFNRLKTQAKVKIASLSKELERLRGDQGAPQLDLSAQVSLPYMYVVLVIQNTTIITRLVLRRENCRDGVTCDSLLCLIPTVPLDHESISMHACVYMYVNI